ncbi:hypothetical protein H2O14_25295 [Rhizobium sp. G21]|nr:hypothetical protein [Rhizobium sp. G21]
MIKAALFDGDGRECAEASQRMQLLPAPVGWSELDGDAVWRVVVEVIRALFAGSTFCPEQVRGIGVTGVMVGAWLVDADGTLLRPPILWNDARAQALVDELATQEPAFSRRFLLFPAR